MIILKEGSMKISEELINKYNKPAPRYTSYPPANYFKEGVSSDDYVKLIERSNNEEPENVSLYLHIPFCNKLCHFCGCNALIKKSESIIQEYIDAMKREILLLAKSIDQSRKLSQIHYGGGTPNAIDARYLVELNELILDNFQTIASPEIAIECNPAYLDDHYINDLHKAKFNRFSIGVQDFDNEVLKIVNRQPSQMPLEELIPKLRKNGALVNLDFIYGLPSQTVDSFRENMKKAIALKPDRLVTFSYAHVPWVKKAQNILEKVGLPSSSEKLKMFEEAYNLLIKSGYKSIGLDHYALENDELSIALKQKQLHRNFQGYCTNFTTGQVYSVGISGISQLNSAYTQTTKDLNEYIESINKDKFCVNKYYTLIHSELIIREVINSFMCNNYVNFNDIAKLHNTTSDMVKNIIEFEPKRFENFVKDDLIELNENEVTLKPDAVLYIRNIAVCFDPLMKNSEKTFSKTV
jgi:oxygen-independent coproporphyrinogen-3 oxidase